MRIPLQPGRVFSEHDNGDRSPVAVISRTFAEHWPKRSPIGQRIRLKARGTPLIAEIVGVVGDVRHDALDRPQGQEVFLAHAQVPFSDMTFVARTIGDPHLALTPLKSQIYAGRLRHCADWGQHRPSQRPDHRLDATRLLVWRSGRTTRGPSLG